MNNLVQIDTTTSKAIREASERKAKKLHFYQNGKPYDTKLTVSIIPGKEFVGLEQFYQFLTEKTQLLNGVQYIFTINGELIQSLEELQHDQTYIISGTKSFIPFPYGVNKPKPLRISQNNSMRYKFIREDDLRLIRPLSSKYNNVYSSANNNRNNIATQSRDIRTVTIVNNKNHNIYSKVILNLRTPKSFDLLLTDLGDAVQMKSPRIMFTSNGQMVKSVSHLKHELTHVNLFYIDNEYPHEPLSLFQLSNTHRGVNYQQTDATCNHCNGFPLQQQLENIDSHSLLYAQSSNYTGTKVIRKELTYSSHSRNKSIPLQTKQNNLKLDICSSPTFIDRSKKELDHGIAFCFEQISPEKYQQIQQYVEKLFNETSFQIQNEGLLIAQDTKSKESKNKIDRNRSSPDISRVGENVNREIPLIQSSIKQKTSCSVASNRNKRIEIEQKNNASSVISKSNLVIQRKHRLKKSSSSLSKSNETSDDQNNNANKNNGDLSTLKPNSQTISKNVKNSIVRKISPHPPRFRKIENPSSNNKLNAKINAKSKSKNLVESSFIQNKVEKEQKSKICDEKFLHGTFSPPKYCLVLDKIFGYNGKKSGNLVYLNTGELAFFSGVFAILWNHNTGKQRFYTEHENDICCLRVDPTCEYIATSHLSNTTMIIRIWSIKTLKTVKILANKLNFVDMEFTSNNSLFTLSGGIESNISLWNWKLKINITNTSKLLDHNEQVFGLTVHPLESDILVSYGKMHLVVWHFKKDKSIECRTALQMQSKIIKTIYCAEFLNDNSLLTGDSIGNLTIWAPFEIDQVLEFAIKEVKGHESQLTCFKLTKENILISGDKDGAIKTWDVNDNEFRLLNAVKLPSLSGSVTSITLPNKLNEAMNIFIGTSNNFILKGSALQTDDYQIIFEGHYMDIKTISIDLKNNIYTASLDRKICKWDEHGLVWKTDANIQGMSSAVHPGGQVLAVGSATGIIIIINANSGKAIQYIQLTTVCIGCMSYSPNGNFLVAGCQDGCLHVIPVSENGRSYDKVSILKGPLPILTLQWSMDTQFILTSVDDSNYQELILWDLPNTRYIRNVTSFSDNLQWYNVTCSGLEDARGTWDNERFKNVINICKNYSPSLKCIVTGDENGCVRLFAYPCYDTKASYFQYKQGGGSVTDVKFSSDENFVVSCNFEGSIFLWRLNEYCPANVTK